MSDTVPRSSPASEQQQSCEPEETHKAEADELAAQLQASAKVNDTLEAPSKLQHGLDERPEADITTQAADGNIYASASKFEDLPLSPELLQGLYVEMKFERPSRVQATTLPMILTPPYKDLIAQAHNGSGKTTCFVLSMLSRVDASLNAPQAVCICPTRELVLQNLQVLQRIGKFSSIRACSTAEGDKRYQPITEQVVIGTHGRLKAWAKQRLLHFDRVKILVLDEADDMLRHEGFADDSVRLIKTVRKQNPSVQLLMFSATFNEDVKKFACTISPSANYVFIAREELSLDVIAQYNVKCKDPIAKSHVLKEMIFPNCEKLGQTIIFVRSREGARALHTEMQKNGYKCTSIQGDMDPSERDKVVEEFRNGVTKILISTDVLARGFDVSQVTLVINYDVPVERDGRTPAYETYLHRIGRSGRFGRKGVAFNLVTSALDADVMHKISSYFNKHINQLEWDDEDAFVEVLQKSL